MGRVREHGAVAGMSDRPEKYADDLDRRARGFREALDESTRVDREQVRRDAEVMRAEGLSWREIGGGDGMSERPLSVDDARQMTDAPSSDFSAGAWCEAAGVLRMALEQAERENWALKEELGSPDDPESWLSLKARAEQAERERDEARHGRDLARLDTENEQRLLAAAEAQLAVVPALVEALRWAEFSLQGWAVYRERQPSPVFDSNEHQDILNRLRAALAKWEQTQGREAVSGITTTREELFQRLVLDVPSGYRQYEGKYGPGRRYHKDTGQLIDALKAFCDEKETGVEQAQGEKP